MLDIISVNIRGIIFVYYINKKIKLIIHSFKLYTLEMAGFLADGNDCDYLL